MDAKPAILSILEERGPEKTMCPSEATRLLPGSWAAHKQDVWSAVYALYDAGRVQVEQEGDPVDPRAASGPVRLRSTE
ncbi:MAG: DUF3253 domain-containing protein [Bacteroidetes bacterium]|nr:DUF3253 domain-containing protein [Bacteroidota bacterium]